MFGLSNKPKASKQKAAKPSAKATKKTSKKGSSQADEAKAVLQKMSAKKDAGDCPFC